MVVYTSKTINLTFPMNSSYLIDTGNPSTTILTINLPTVSLSNFGTEVVFIKNNGLDQIISSPGSYLIGPSLALNTTGYFTMTAATQYYRLIATRTKEGYLVWMWTGSG